MGSIKPNDLNELKKLGKPSDIIKLIFDCVSLLKMAPLVKTETAEVEPKYIILLLPITGRENNRAQITLGVGKDKKTFMFLKDSYKIVQAGILTDTRFLQSIIQFSKVSISPCIHTVTAFILTYHVVVETKVEKDFINDETVELMTPYLALDGFRFFMLCIRTLSRAI